MPSHRRRRVRRPLLTVALLGAALIVGVAATTVPSGSAAGAAPAAFSHHRHPRPKPTPTVTPTPRPTTTAPTTPAPPAPTTTAAPTTSAPATAAPTTPSEAGWITVDPATQAAETAAFFARTPRALPAGNPRTTPEFAALCKTFHRNNDDPIVFPGLVGASHNHTFWGNSTTKADSTLTSLENGETERP